MYDKYTARPFGRLFLVLHPNIAVLPVPNWLMGMKSNVKAVEYTPSEGT